MVIFFTRICIYFLGYGKEEVKKAKNVLCKNYMMGNCQFADNCLYAHGLHELQNPNYKTEMCQNLPNCKFGDICKHAHSKVVMDQLTDFGFGNLLRNESDRILI